MNERGQVLVSFDRFCTCGFGGEVKVEVGKGICYTAYYSIFAFLSGRGG